ncbi:hypothetical protein PINS_up019981 [Pythium insidiosum]|nr:hypothetical protein PINS_up019981 [Pythium insidiosum]
MLTLVEETIVLVDSSKAYKAKRASIAARHAAKPVEATRRELFHAIHELKDVIAKRELAAEEAKIYFLRQRELRARMKKEMEEELKQKMLLRTKEKLQAEAECTKMRNAELETREYLRMLRTSDNDLQLRTNLAERRKQHEENEQMTIEEYQMRYFIAERRRRIEENEQIQREVEKRNDHLKQQETERMNQLMAILKADEEKRRENELRRQKQKAEEAENWLQLSKLQQQEALLRLQLKEKIAQNERQRIEEIARASEEQHRLAVYQKEESRLRKQRELEREEQTRHEMEKEERYLRQVHFQMKKATQAQTWSAKREKELLRYSIDPMHFSKIQAMKEVEERERRERFLTRAEDELALAIRDKERKERYLADCRANARRRKDEMRRSTKEITLMETEDKRAHVIREAEVKAQEAIKLRERMRRLAEADQRRRDDALSEARNRKMMHSEEMLQRRVELLAAQVEEMRAKHERELMASEETVLRAHLCEQARERAKRERKRNIVKMMREDVASMSFHDWIDEGLRLEELLWPPGDAVAFRELPSQHVELLVINASLFKELTGLALAPPFDLDYEAVFHNAHAEGSMPLDQVPRKRRKQRKFFYHEYFEEDPILSKLKPAPLPPVQPSAARQRWRKLADHFFSKTWSSEATRDGYLLMTLGKYAEASKHLLEGVRLAQASPSTQPSASLLRQLARCYSKRWEISLQRCWLSKSLHFLHQASSHVFLLASPPFLQEIALVLERLCKYRESAEIIAGIIQCFPKYSRLNEVIFRGGIVMFALKMYRQSREYMLHTLESPAPGWEAHEVLFLAARAMQHEGQAQRKLCSVAYDEAFRSNKRDAYYRSYPTWKEWIKDPDTWRVAGDRYFAKKELVLAKDAYLTMIKRQVKRPAKLLAKRQRVIEANQVLKQQREESKATDSSQKKPATQTSWIDDHDWLRLARTYAALNELSAAEAALDRWLARRSYRDRVFDQYVSWPNARWKLLGVEVPRRVLDAQQNRLDKIKAEEEKKRQELEQKRQLVLRQRSLKAKDRLLTWDAISTEQQPAASVDSSDEDKQHQMGRIEHDAGSWRYVVDENTGEAYYWNEDTGEVAWSLSDIQDRSRLESN